MNGDPVTVSPSDQLTLANVQQYTQPIDSDTHSFELSQWLVPGFVQAASTCRAALPSTWASATIARP